MAFETHHHAWLLAHPNRTVEWLTLRLAEGFHVHHADGDHANDHPDNLLLIEGSDHMLLHGIDVRKLRATVSALAAIARKKIPAWKRKSMARKAARARWRKAKTARLAAKSRRAKTVFAKSQCQK